MIHYHGTPISGPESALMRMAGRHFCVSYGAPRQLETCLRIGQSVMFDNGAFSAFTRGAGFDEAGFLAWVEPNLSHPHWAVIPDVIDGIVEAQRELVARWPFGHMGAPVWHLGLPVEYLLELANEWPRVCFGSTAQFWQVGSDQWSRRMDEAYNALERRNLRPWVHGLRMMDVASWGHWPLASADSVNVGRNWGRADPCPDVMAARIDAVQTPRRWRAVEEQCDLFS